MKKTKKGMNGAKMGGIFDDIFSDEDFEIKDEEIKEIEDIDWSPEDEPEKANPHKSDAIWNTGNKQDIWTSDDPWTCDDDCDAKSDCSNCDSDDNDSLSDWL